MPTETIKAKNPAQLATAVADWMNSDDRASDESLKTLKDALVAQGILTAEQHADEVDEDAYGTGITFVLVNSDNPAEDTIHHVSSITGEVKYYSP